MAGVKTPAARATHGARKVGKGTLQMSSNAPNVKTPTVKQTSAQAPAL